MSSQTPNEFDHPVCGKVRFRDNGMSVEEAKRIFYEVFGKPDNPPHTGLTRRRISDIIEE